MIVKQIVIHHTASSRDRTTLQDVNAWHKLRWADFKSSLGYWVGYHYLITGDGKITQTRRDNEMGAHCIPNDGKIGVCLTGNFMTETPTQAQIDALKRVLGALLKTYGLKYTDIKAHRELSQTLCPGNNLVAILNKIKSTNEQISIFEKAIDSVSIKAIKDMYQNIIDMLKRLLK